MVDWGDVLSYSTTKVVKIRDKRLGVGYLLFVFGVFLYALFYVLLLKKQYLELALPSMSLRLNLQQPANLSLMDPTLLPYCAQNPVVYEGISKNPCLVMDQFDVVFPPPSGGEIFMSSRITKAVLALPPNCTSQSSLQCVFPPMDDSNSSETTYTAGLEDFTLFVDHTMVVSRFAVTKPFHEMEGRLLDQNDQEIMSWQPGPVQDARNVFSIRQLLSAAGIDNLDTARSVTYKNGTSMRDDGVVLMLTVSYSNWVPDSLYLSSFDVWRYTYTYRVLHVADTEFKTYESQYLNYPTNKLVSNRHGIRIVILPEGQVGRFSFPVFLIALVSSFGLLSASVILLDFVATTIVPQRNLYTQAKFDQVNQPSISSPQGGLSERFLDHRSVNSNQSGGL